MQIYCTTNNPFTARANPYTERNNVTAQTRKIQSRPGTDLPPAGKKHPEADQSLGFPRVSGRGRTRTGATTGSVKAW